MELWWWLQYLDEEYQLQWRSAIYRLSFLLETLVGCLANPNKTGTLEYQKL
jgi:hypothetical protein